MADPHLAGSYPMRPIVKRLSASFALVLIAFVWISPPASAITVELAKKCRAIALKAHPMSLPGAKNGTAQAERAYYSACIANNGTMPDNNTQNTTAPAAK